MTAALRARAPDTVADTLDPAEPGETTARTADADGVSERSPSSLLLLEEMELIWHLLTCLDPIMRFFRCSCCRVVRLAMFAAGASTYLLCEAP